MNSQGCLGYDSNHRIVKTRAYSNFIEISNFVILKELASDEVLNCKLKKCNTIERHRRLRLSNPITRIYMNKSCLKSYFLLDQLKN